MKTRCLTNTTRSPCVGVMSGSRGALPRSINYKECVVCNGPYTEEEFAALRHTDPSFQRAPGQRMSDEQLISVAKTYFDHRGMRIKLCFRHLQELLRVSSYTLRKIRRLAIDRPWETEPCPRIQKPRRMSDRLSRTKPPKKEVPSNAGRIALREDLEREIADRLRVWLRRYTERAKEDGTERFTVDVYNVEHARQCFNIVLNENRISPLGKRSFARVLMRVAPRLMF